MTHHPLPAATNPDTSRPAATGGLATMHPAYFAMVMATGIVSTAAHLLGLHAVAVPLYYLNVLFFLIISALTLLRIARYPQNVLADLLHPDRHLDLPVRDELAGVFRPVREVVVERSARDAEPPAHRRELEPAVSGFGQHIEPRLKKQLP